MWQKKWMEVNDLSSGQYSVNKNRFKTSMLRLDLCGYINVYIVVKMEITAEIKIVKLTVLSTMAKTF